jgi:hypothetical protein
MSIYEHVTQLAGKPVIDWEPDTPLSEPEAVVYRISLSYDEAEEGAHWTDKLADFLDQPGCDRVTGLIVGAWEEVWETVPAAIVAALVAARDPLPALRALFFGEIVSEECEISWIHQTDLSPLFDAYPLLEQFTVRGAEGLSLGTLRHERLKALTLQSGGLPASVVREVAAAELPQLEHLELWLGEDQYGADFTLADLAPILSGDRFPRLRYLGLRDSDQADDIAAAVAAAPVLDRARVLDLSLGTLTDAGAAALLTSPAAARLEKLDIHHHFCSEAMVTKLQALGVPIDASERQDPHRYGSESHLYVAVGE